MKFPTRMLVVVTLFLSLLLVPACQGSIPTPAAVDALQAQLTASQSALIAANTTLKQQEAAIAATGTTGAKIAALQTQIDALQAAAATQPNAATSSAIAGLRADIAALANAPGSGVDPKLVQAVTASSSALTLATQQMSALAQTVTDLKTNLATAKTKDEQTAATIQAGTAVAQQGVNAIPVWGGTASLVVGLVGAAVAGFYRNRAQSAVSASNSIVDAVQNALSTGAMTAGPSAVGQVDSVVVAHPITDRLVDIVAAAATPAK